MKRWYWVFGLVFCLTLTGCGNNTTEDTESEDTTEAISELVLPVGNVDYRKIPEEVPAACTPVENPGTREHFSFVVDDKKYIFTETETLWLYNQSVIHTFDTQFLLNANGSKVTIALPDTAEANTLNLEEYSSVYSDDVVNIYRKENSNTVTEDEVMYITLYDMVYKVTNWSELVSRRVISFDRLYTGLAQMGTAIVPAEETETLSDVITAMSVNPVLDDYKMAFREGIPYSGFIFCSPSSGNANHDDISIYMSVKVPEWETFATVHIEPIPDYQERLEETGETFDGHPILVDYTGELKYFVLGENGTCIYLDGVLKNSSNSTKSYSAAEAAYIFELVLTK